MKYEQLKKIQEKLARWKQERQLDLHKQLKGLPANLLEECTEFLRAEDDYERVDALCDIIVFGLNALEDDGLSPEQVINCKYVFQHKLDDEMHIRCLCMESAELVGGLFQRHSKLQSVQVINRIIYIAIDAIKKLGYNPLKCMLETIKEISSRTGEWNETIKKFVKYQGAYNDFEASDYVRKLDDRFEIVRETSTHWHYGLVAGNKCTEGGRLVKWYRADYSKCKGNKS